MWWRIALVGTAIVFDGIDNQLLGIVIPSVMAEWELPRGAFAPVVSFGYLGMMIGGAAAGVIGDRLGRRTALLGSMAVFGLMTLAGGLTSSIVPFGVARFLAGLGLGGAIPNAAALAGEYVPSPRRPIAITVTIVCVPLGGALAGLLGIQVLPVVGWRTLFMIGGLLPVAAAIAMRWLLPESPEFLARRLPATGKASVTSVFVPEFRHDTSALWIAFFSCLLSVYLGFAWLTTLLTTAGFDPATANMGITAFNFGGVAGALLGGFAIARVGSKVSMLTMAAVAIVGAVMLAFIPISPAAAVWPVIAMIGVVGAAINGVQTTMYALAAHVYPTAIRATGVGSAVAFGRIGAVLTGYIGSWAIGMGGAPAYFGVVAVMMLVTFVALAAVTRHVRAGG